MSGPEWMQVGGGADRAARRRRRPSRRQVLTALAVLMIMVVVGTWVGRWAWISAHTFTADQIDAALQMFRPPGTTSREPATAVNGRQSTRDQSTGDQPTGDQTTEDQDCAQLLRPAGGEVDAIDWNPSPGNSERGAVVALRYADIGAAKDRLQTIDDLLRRCPSATLGTTWDVATRPRSWQARLTGAPLSWELAPRSADAYRFRLAVGAARYGNVIFFYTANPSDTSDTAEALEALIATLQTRH